MAAIDPARDARGARWEQRLRIPVLAAAWLALPTVFLYFSELHGSVHGVAVVLSWLIWVVFLVEAVVMLSVVRDRRAWIRGHVFSLESLLAARAVTSVQAIRGLQVLYLAKAGKLIKGLLIVRRSGRAPKHPVLATAAGLLIAATLVGIGDRIATGDKKPTPLHGTAELLAELPHWSLALAAGAVAAIVLALVTGRRRRA
jgi:hypothetical protein